MTRMAYLSARIHRIACALLGAAALLIGCKQEVTSQEPALTRVTPQVACGAQRGTTVTLDGSGLSPLPIDTLTGSPRIELPRVLLRLQTRADGAPADGPEIAVPDETPDGQLFGHVRWHSTEQMSFDVSPGLLSGQDLTPGLYDVAVKNPDGRRAVLQGALAVLAPPVLQTAVPSPVCNAQGEVTLTLSGARFLQWDSALPLVRFFATTGDGGQGEPRAEVTAASVSGCAPLPAPQGVSLSSCTGLTVTVPQAALSAGSYRVSVQDPGEGACASAEDVRVAVVPPPRVDEITSAAICTAQAESRVVLRGAGFLVVSEAGTARGPTVTLGGMSFQAQAGDCAPVPDAPAAQTCATLTVIVPQGALGPGTYPLSIRNPQPAPCGLGIDMALSLEVVPPPTLDSVNPTVICAGGGTVSLQGGGMRAGASVLIGDVAATKVTVAGDGRSATADFAGPFTPPGPYPVTFRNADGCAATLQSAMRVTPGPSILFVDPPAVPLGVPIQATVYGSGVTTQISSVEIAPTGTSAYRALTFQTDPQRPNRVLASLPADLAAGTYDMRIKDGTLTCPGFLSGALRVVPTQTLTVDAITPAFGTTAADTAVVVSGAGFVAQPRVYFNPTGSPPGSRAQALAGVTFQSATSLTGVVRAGLPAGTYDVIVLNPDGSFGIKAALFKGTAADAPPPVITSIAPSSVVSGTATQVSIQGSGFRAGATVSLRCQDATGATTAGASASVSAVSATAVSATVTGTGVLCLARVTNADGTSFEYSAIGVTNASLNLTGFRAGSALTTARRALAASAGRPTAVARFVYAVGGDNGTDAGALDTVESAPTDLAGTLGRFTVQGQRLPGKRSFLGLANLGRFLYAVGGHDGAAASRQVFRAELLSPLRAPQVSDVDVVFHKTQGLDAGQYIYRVSAVMGSGDLNNPGGETLAGDPFPIKLPAVSGGKLQLVILIGAVSGAQSYRVYRSPRAGDAAGGELLLGVVQAGASPLQLVDDGTAAAQGAGPLPLGATGAWRALPQLGTARLGPGVAVARDPADASRYYLYAAGGSSGAPASPTPLSSVEFLPITVDGSGDQAVGTWTAAGSALLSARWLVTAVAATADNNSRIGAGTTQLYVASGASGAGLTTPDERVDVAQVQAGGQLSAFTDARSPGGGIKRVGAGIALVNNILMAFGGLQGGAAVNNSVSATLKTATTLENFNSLGSGGLTAARALQGTALESAFIYQLGGASGAPGTAQATTEQTIW